MEMGGTWYLGDASDSTPVKMLSITVSSGEDTEPPWITITHPNDGAELAPPNGRIPITWDGGDNEGTVTYRLWINKKGQVYTGFQESYTTIFPGGFSYIVQVKAIDEAGNTKSDTVSFYVKEWGIEVAYPEAG